MVNTQLTLAGVSFHFILCCRLPIRYLCSDQVDLESQLQSSPGSGDNYIELPEQRFQPLPLSQCKRKIHRVQIQDGVKIIFALRVRVQVQVRQEGKLPKGSRASVSAHLPNKPLQLFYFWIIRSIQVTQHNDNKQGTRREVPYLKAKLQLCRGL